MLGVMTRSPPSHPHREFEFAGWQQAAGAYADTFELATQRYADALLDAVAPQPGDALLDNACGTGSVAAAAVKRGAAVVGADFSPAMLAEARRIHPSICFTTFRSPSALCPRCAAYYVRGARVLHGLGYTG